MSTRGSLIWCRIEMKRKTLLNSQGKRQNKSFGILCWFCCKFQEPEKIRISQKDIQIIWFILFCSWNPEADSQRKRSFHQPTFRIFIFQFCNYWFHYPYISWWPVFEWLIIFFSKADSWYQVLHQHKINSGKSYCKLATNQIGNYSLG